MDKPRFLFQALIMMLLLSACSKILIPLEVNNEWVYEQIITFKGEVTNHDTLTNVIAAKTQLNGKDWFVSNEFDNTFIIRNTNKAQVEIDTSVIEPNLLYREFPVFVYPRSKDPITYEVFFETVTVNSERFERTTPAGTFSCYKYEFRMDNDPSHVIDTYISPGVGIVYVYMKDGEQEITQELLKYDLK